MSIPSFPKPPTRGGRQDAMLSAEEELALARAWRQSGNAAARQRLVICYLPLVLKMAGRFRGYGLPVEDLVAEGNIGLLRALDGFDTERGLRLSTYAMWWVRASMYEYVLRFSTPVSFPVTADRKRVFFKLKALKAKLLGPRGGQLSQDETASVARHLKVGAKTVTEMDRLISLTPRSLDAPLVSGKSVSLGDLLPDERPDAETLLAERQERALRRDGLARSWPALSEREQNILAERTLREKPLRLEELAKRYSISRERVRQIEGEAIRKLRRLMVTPDTALAAG
ncbi:RNA polymerase sigma-32 factor [Paramagnetospirillum caucaseum]|uniref:RNA polymerase sigma-32 factor n=1 Tax=Paramagnetospirillum caucaseum TaxID=1244869 RepID=M2Y6S7_9PROT|nr:sigma-70 family RNA polymerase sigma factor [Paramagnetospirillum caucaseum]EME68761.1 RNA polymerase sigma-32 factor [Paramagnetospirillum caucaseum]